MVALEQRAQSLAPLVYLAGQARAGELVELGRLAATWASVAVVLALVAWEIAVFDAPSVARSKQRELVLAWSPV